MTRNGFRTLTQLRLREHQLFFALTIVVGVLAGLVAVLFTVAIDWATRLFFGLDPSLTRLALVPVVVSLATGLLLAYVFPGSRGSGVPQTVAAYRLHDGAIPARVPIGKFITGVLGIGSGHSMGREGPSVQLGAGLASFVGRVLRLPPARIKDLVPVGAAGALAAAFNTPIAAVLFTLEEIIGDMNATLLGSTVVASVASVVVARSILGNDPFFRVPTYHLVHPAELLAYALLGVVGGVISLGFCWALLRLRQLVMALPANTRALQPAMGGVIIGGILVIAPQVMGVGYASVDQALNGGLLLNTMLWLGAVKLVATLVSYCSGNAGGIFAPSLFIGAMVGGALGSVVHWVAPFPTADPGAYALVGMGALFAGIIRAPMTSVFMIFEITQDYQIVVPLMVANLLSYAIAKRYQPTSVYHALLEQDGVVLSADAEGDTGGGADRPDRLAAAIMRPAGPWTSLDATVQQVWERVRESGGAAVLVGEPAHFKGLVTRVGLAEAVRLGRAEEPVARFVQEGRSVFPDARLEAVLECLADGHGLVPVISRDEPRQVVGVITVADLSQAIAAQAT